MRTMQTWLMAASLMATVACGNNNMMMNGDTGPHDSGTMDTGMNNDGGTDAHPDTHVGPDVPPPNYLTGTCMMPVNLNMRGTALPMGVGRTTYMLSLVSALHILVGLLFFWRAGRHLRRHVFL